VTVPLGLGNAATNAVIAQSRKDVHAEPPTQPPNILTVFRN